MEGGVQGGGVVKSFTLIPFDISLTYYLEKKRMNSCHHLSPVGRYLESRF